ncbi:nitrogenase-stabilizing/protective protein NifW [Psychromonas ossibalaenae]|uniref:nitrogenase-stabilizing/protective protein NifW n=1 Tax=Psychromonas ossibalaenae TaxID=444922 RepID=UPI0003681802|nr:nitrogenase-stabilizing/protective protein NifW [Psychromonas ossibalaenae]
MSHNKAGNIQEQIRSFTSIEQALNFFEISFDQTFVDSYRLELLKRFLGNLLLSKAADWFDGRRALKNAYCKIQRGRLDKKSRSACRGCTSCERR